MFAVPLSQMIGWALECTVTDYSSTYLGKNVWSFSAAKFLESMRYIPMYIKLYL
jgi:hypothetical protein